MIYALCNKADMSAIAQMEAKYIECPWNENVLNESFEQREYVFIKAEENDVLVGYGSVQIVFDEGNINNIAVDLITAGAVTYNTCNTADIKV